MIGDAAPATQKPEQAKAAFQRINNYCAGHIIRDLREVLSETPKGRPSAGGRTSPIAIFSPSPLRGRARPGRLETMTERIRV